MSTTNKIVVAWTIYFVIPAVAKRRAEIQRKSLFYWIPAFAGMTR